MIIFWVVSLFVNGVLAITNLVFFVGDGGLINLFAGIFCAVMTAISAGVLGILDKE